MVKTNQDSDKNKKTVPSKSASAASKTSKTTKKEPVTSTVKPKSEKKPPATAASPKPRAKPAVKAKKAVEEVTELKIEVKEKIIVEPVAGAEPKIEIIPVLQPSVGEAPIYSLNEDVEVKARTVAFHKIVPQDDLVQALNKAGYEHADANLHKILQAVLRGSDVFANKPDHGSSFLIGAVGSAYKVLSGALTRAEAKQPLALVLTNDEKKLNELFANTTKVFPQHLNVHFALLSEKTSDEEKQVLLGSHIDILFSTV
ncbi:MAG: hypothetical protein V4591_04890, partial [Bdellovibrionota bacterium]